ncbi:DUF6752 domain-containing protein [Actinomycetospora termitidis]|uniref:DUF6752 domain-containing protein n=1 Tax=Actinomycetospora termitidis TaxID=3053470 RepID=A0ABT7M384_9PSEU|nr:DUF6752 domain-containing protein [Actinomycetospora sp. Odt1-22]MDL5154664.1 hypothetical protein [Actinomycetospora sp. Odt1-22]
MKNPVRVLGSAARRVLVPEWTAVLHDVEVLRSDRDNLLSDIRILRAELADLQQRADGLREESERLRGRVEALDVDIDEGRRLSARVAEVTDLVTEVVLPLHDREIDIVRLRDDDAEPT